MQNEHDLQELVELARHAPDRLGERLADVRLESQVDLALRLPAAARLELLLHAPKPMRLVRMLPDAELYLTVREVGPTDALPLVALAAAPQLVHLVDLESWRHDEFDAKRCGAWVALFLESGENVLRRLLREIDDELLVLLLQKWARVKQIEHDDTPDEHGHGETETGTDAGFLAPDGYHRFSPLIPEHGPAIRRLLELLASGSVERYQRVMWSALWEPTAEVEERALHWRQSRLEEHGFVPWDEAIEVYAPPEGSRRRPPARDHETATAPRTPLRWVEPSRRMVAALARLPEVERERILGEVVAVANRVLVADSADTGDPDCHRGAMRRAASYLEIGLASRGGGSDSDASRLLAETPVLELFREGYRRAAEVQQRARAMVEDGWASAHPAAPDLLDAPLGPALSGLLRPRPMHFDATAESEADAFHDFRSLEEIDEAAVALRMAETLGRVFVERLGLDVATLVRKGDELPHGTPRFSTLFLTSLAWCAASDELRCEPLPAEITARFLRTVASRRTADPAAPGRALDQLLDRIGAAIDLGLDEHQALRAFGKACLEKLDNECSALDPGAPVDPRFVSCLLVGSS
jgi:hypothetical protein